MSGCDWSTYRSNFLIIFKYSTTYCVVVSKQILFPVEVRLHIARRHKLDDSPNLVNTQNTKNRRLDFRN